MNKNFLITGASSGLGEKFSILISDIAKKIVIVGRKRNKLLKIKKEINRNNKLVKVFMIVADLSKKSGALKLIQRLQKNTEIQSIDVLVNSAAKFTVKKIENISIKDLDSDFQLNIISPFLISKYIGLKMKKKRKGVIFNIGSSSAYDCSKETSIYCSTKHALLGMSKAFNTELQSHGVKSIFIAPGSMKTPMGRKVKNQNYNTFIDPKEVATMMKNLLNDRRSMLVEEIKIKRKVYK
jgi:short-subunit dehydrogenase|tara:strand:- start:41 stop:754 length:714 start_codon:yes stop_codon:yes gene_type:complete